MKKGKRRKIAIISIAVLGMLVFLRYVPAYVINLATNHRFHYSVQQMKDILAETHYENLGLAPDKKHTLHLLVSSWLSTEYSIEATTRFSTDYKKVLLFAEEHFKVPDGPLQKKQTPVVASKDSRYIALIAAGWYVDCYDFQQEENISPEGHFFMGDYHTKEYAEDFQELKTYHNKIANLLGQETISVLQNLEELQESKQ